ncbi:MAG: 3-methyl-2-oxobutanoate hydroxymethyltransferase [Gammaproteobacteria bacterium]|jgi:3-methyl-2-oxobutanoate hydroxymethyltransferase
MTTLTATDLKQMKQRGEKIAVLTAYDASFATQLENAGVEVLLVGDSLGMVLQGHETTLPVTIDDMVYHTSMVSRVRQRAYLVSDFSYQTYETPEQALTSAQKLIAAGADMVKLEGGHEMLPVIKHLVDNSIPVCGHLGLLPQSVEKLGGYKVQGRDEQGAQTIIDDAIALSSAGIELLVLECIPAELAANVTAAIDIPTIGIGAGPDCDGQVLVVYDMLGLYPGKRPKFSKDFLLEQGEGKGVEAAFKAYVQQVKEKAFPDIEHSFS